MFPLVHHIRISLGLGVQKNLQFLSQPSLACCIHLLSKQMVPGVLKHFLELLQFLLINDLLHHYWLGFHVHLIF